MANSTRTESKVTADNVDAWLDVLEDDPEFKMHDAAPMRAIIAARRMTERSDQVLADAVAAGRKAGLSWSEIGVSLGGVSKQAAQQRFG